MSLKRRSLYFLLSILGGLAVWRVVAAWVSQLVFPNPLSALGHLVSKTLSLEFPRMLLASLGHMAGGFFLALIVAIPLGFVLGRSRTAAALIEPVLNAIYAVPTVAFVPLLVIWFGLFFEARTALVFLMCVFDMTVTISAGVKGVERSLLDLARSYNASRWLRWTRVLMPASLPFILTAVRIGVVRATNGMITAELFFASVNLGAYMKQAENNFNSAGLVAVLALLALVGLVLQTAVKVLETRLVPWHVRQA